MGRGKEVVMSVTGVHSIDSSITRTNSWLADIADSLGVDDRRLAFRIARAWLHALRDHLTVDAAAGFGAELTEVLRGIYYESWKPGQVPVRSSAAEYAARFAHEARIRAEQVPAAAGVITGVARRHMAPEVVERAFAVLPPNIRELLDPEPAALTSERAE
jgi:uncharacterized protein (DUF2267 family)